MALRAEVVYLVGPDVPNQGGQRGRVGQVAVMEEKAGVAPAGMNVHTVYPLGVERGRPSLYPVHRISLVEQKLRQVAAILAGGAGYECHS